MFADGNVSIVLNLGSVCHERGQWLPDALGPHGQIIGPMTTVGPEAEPQRPEMFGVYLRPGHALAFMHTPLCEIKNRIVDLRDVWGNAGARLPEVLGELTEDARIQRFEWELLRRLKQPRGASSVDLAGIADCALRSGGRVSIEQLADSAGASRQHLARIFRERIGVTPKTYCQLARFQSALAYAGRADVEWADAALATGYADQSHMIKEFRRFSSLTPERLATGAWFHPFIERAKTHPADVAA